MRLPFLHNVFAGALLLTLGGSASAWAQLTAKPTALDVALRQHETTERSVTLRNAGDEAASFCLSFERPLQRAGGTLRLGDQAAGTACGDLGEILYELDEDSADVSWSPDGMTMTPDGRLFASDFFQITPQTHELTLELELVRSFPHPIVDDLANNPVTGGLTYNPDTGTLWWMNIEQKGINFRRALLLEGDLDGTPTGRRIEVPSFEPDALGPASLSYDPATARFYLGGSTFEGQTTIWALDTLGQVVDGYPVEQQAYPGAPALDPDAYGGLTADGTPTEPEAVRLELAVAPGNEFDRLVVVDPWGADLGIETPLPDVSGGTIFGSIEGESLRSRVDPNGVLYFPFTNVETEGVVGIRPHPLPPSWLTLSRWDGELEPGESVEITLTFEAGTRDVGNSYEAALQVFEAESGDVLEVPLTFEVVPGTGAEDGAATPSKASLSAWPNPARGAATAMLALPEASEVRVAVYDVLGREAVTLHDGPLAAGEHRFDLDAARLPTGVYLVRATGDGFATSRRITVVR